MTETQQIFFDEAGFTGNDLLNDAQPFFVYASIAITPSQAAEIITEMTSRFKLQGRELKGSNLVSYPRGQGGILWLIERCKDNACIVFADKKYALTGKFFEYIFEPVLQVDNSLFYAIRFQRFIANFLYISFIAKDQTATNLLIEFQSLMRSPSLTSLDQLLPPPGKIVAVNNPISQIQTFIMCNKERIKREIEGVTDAEGISKWILELTTTSLFWMLSFWSERFDILDVYCDNSKPIADNPDMFNVMIGREDNIYVRLGSDPERRLIFNLANPITFLDSKKSPGIQIADILASSIAYTLNHPQDTFSKTCIQVAESTFSPLCIVPDPKEIDLRQKVPAINAIVLNELIERTIKQESLIDGMREFVSFFYTKYELSPPNLD